MDTGQDIIEPINTAEIVHCLIEKLKASYIFPEVAAQICEGLLNHLHAGDYDDIREGDFLALALTMHLQEVNHDEHIWVRWHDEPLPEEVEQLRLDPEWQEQRRMEASLDNYGLHKLEWLPGNVGVIEITYFHRPEWGGEAASATLNFLVDANALIFDLRQCTGGYPGMLALICSYLFGEAPIHLSSIYWRDEDITQQYWTLPYVPGKHFVDKPVYVLTSKVTFSAGEEFAYDLQVLERATVVGEKTDGGAHPGASYRLHPHFEAFIPIGRVINPITGTNWEGCGITPDTVVPAEKALEVAYRLALKSIIESLGQPASEPTRQLLKEAQEALARLQG